MMNETEKANVLVIDDDPDICSIIVEIAEDLGCNAQSSAEKKDILLKIKQSWDCVIVDLTMPDLDGIEVLRLLAQQDCRAPIILISGFSKGMLISARKLGEIRGLTIAETLTKPIDINKLETIVLDALALGKKAADDAPAKDAFASDWMDADVDHGGVIPYYQPKIDIKSGRLAGFEALARWWHPKNGLLPPSAFIPQAIENGKIDEITMAMVEKIAMDIKAWSGSGDTPMIAINVEADSLADLELPSRIEGVLNQHGVEAVNLILEITESGVFKSFVDAMDNLIRFRVKGYALAIDDFGTGHSTLSQLQDMPFNQLKVDKSFVDGIGQNVQSEAIVASTIDLAHRLGMNVVAEGVENVEQIDFLRAHGCDQLQGYYFAKPMNAADASLWRNRHAEQDFSAA